jgi:endoglucanase
MKRCFFFFCCLFVYSKSFCITDSIPFGINLAGAEFGLNNLPGVYNTDYTYPTVAEIKYFSAKGFTLLRLPFRWERIQQALGGSLDTTQVRYINTFIDSCAVYGMKVILDMHNYGKYYINQQPYSLSITKGDTLNIKYLADAWTKIATVFKQKKNIYGYDIMNQPDSLNTDVWPIAAQTTIDAIRTIDFSTNILIDGEKRSLAECWANCNDALKKLIDPSNKIIYIAHCFFDKDGVGNYTSTSYDSLEADIYTGVKRVTPFVEWLKLYNKKGIVASYGIPNNDYRWLSLLDTFMNYISSNCVGGTYWAAGPWWHNYTLSAEPDSLGNDKVQMQILTKYLTTTCTQDSIPASQLPQVYFYPNPTTGTLFVDQGNCNNYKSISIYDMLGRRVYMNTLQLNKNIIDVGNIPSGMLFVVLLAADGTTYKQKIIKLK